MSTLFWIVGTIASIALFGFWGGVLGFILLGVILPAD